MVWGLARQARGWLWMGMLLGTLSWVAGCATSARQSTTTDSQLSGKQLAQAEKVYAQLRREVSLHKDRKSLELAGNLLDYYPAFDRNDEVLLLAVDAAARLDDLPQAQGLAEQLLARYPQSPLVDQTLLKASDLALAQTDTFTATVYQLRYYDRDPLRATLSSGLPRCDTLLKSLGATELALLMDQEQGQALWSYLGYLRTVDLLNDGLYPQAEAVVAELRSKDEDENWTVAAAELLTGGGVPGQSPVRRPTLGRINMEQVGVLAPLTGRYAVLGNAFYDGAIQALDAANGESGGPFVLKVEDTGADPVSAALAARRLCSEDGCGSLFGSLMSSPTVAGALVADAYGVPLVSPTATNDHIWQLGEGILQPNLTGLHEVRLLAQLATTVMLKKRFAILHENTPEGDRMAEVFTAEVEKHGGRVVAGATYNLADTDFKKAILALKKERPEVIFAPATVDQMILLAPQLDFYKAGALILGMSNWNSPRLFERTGTVLEQVIFPDDLALFPAAWSAEFQAVWQGDNYPQEATALALKSYQAMRMLLDTIQQSGATNRSQLQDALQRRLANRDIQVSGPASFSNSVRIFRNGQARHFPADIFSEGWELTAAGEDSLTQEIPLQGIVPETRNPAEGTR